MEDVHHNTIQTEAHDSRQHRWYNDSSEVSKVKYVSCDQRVRRHSASKPKPIQSKSGGDCSVCKASTCCYSNFTAGSETDRSKTPSSPAPDIMSLAVVCFFVVLTCFKSGPRCSPHCTPPRACGLQAVVRPQCKRPRPASAAVPYPEPESLLAAYVPLNSCTAPKRRGRITHQTRERPFGGFGQDRCCSPPTS